MASLTQRVRTIIRSAEILFLSFAGMMPVHRLRVWALRICGAHVDGSATLYHGSQPRHARGLVIGARTTVGHRALLDARGGLHIGADINISNDVHFHSMQHLWNAADFMEVERLPITVGDRVWIGPRVTVLPGVTIGEGAVVAAGAVVAKDVAPWTLVGGVPAKHIADRDPKDYTLRGPREKLWWW